MSKCSILIVNYLCLVMLLSLKVDCNFSLGCGQEPY